MLRSFYWFFCQLFHWENRLWLWCNNPEIEDTLANTVTICRGKLALYVCPILYGSYLLTGFAPLAVGGFVLAVACGLADAIDGWLAKRYGTSESGKYLDPVADSLAVFWGGLVPIVLEYHFDWKFVVPLAGISLCGGAIYYRRIRTGMATHRFARMTMFIIYCGGVACFFGILGKFSNDRAMEVAARAGGLLFLWSGFAMMVVSAMHYYNVFWPLLFGWLFRGTRHIT